MVLWSLIEKKQSSAPYGLNHEFDSEKKRMPMSLVLGVCNSIVHSFQFGQGVDKHAVVDILLQQLLDLPGIPVQRTLF